MFRGLLTAAVLICLSFPAFALDATKIKMQCTNINFKADVQVYKFNTVDWTDDEKLEVDASTKMELTAEMSLTITDPALFDKYELDKIYTISLPVGVEDIKQ